MLEETGCAPGVRVPRVVRTYLDCAALGGFAVEACVWHWVQDVRPQLSHKSHKSLWFIHFEAVCAHKVQQQQQILLHQTYRSTR